MRTIQRLIYSKSLFFIVVSAVILGLNLTPLILQAKHTPPGRTFVLVHNNVQDFFFYQSLMNEGANGQWSTNDPYTTENHQSSFIFSYFLILGKISKALFLPYSYTYHAVRIVFGILLFAASYYLIYFLKTPFPKLTFLLFVFAGPLLRNSNVNGEILPLPYMNWWTGMDAIRRSAYLPHHMIGGFLLVLIIISLLKYSKDFNYKYIIISILLSLLLSYIHTPSLFIILISLPVAIFLFIITNRAVYKEKLQLSHLISGDAKRLSYLLIFWIVGITCLFIMLLQTRLGFPWSQYLSWEKKLQFPLDREIIGALGILVPFSIIGIITSIKSKSFEKIFISCWLLTPILLLPFSSRIGISNIRLIQGLPYLSLAITSIIGINYLNTLVKRLFPLIRVSLTLNNKTGDAREGSHTEMYRSMGNSSGRTRIRIMRNSFLKNLFLIAALILFSIFTYPSLSWSLKDQIREFWPIFGNVYIDNRLNNAFAFINKNYPKDTNTLSTFYSGNFLPAYTHTRSFIGHSGYTNNIEEKEQLVKIFFENKMSSQEAKSFILSNNIALIYQGPEEKPIYNDYLYPKILTPVYDREEVTLYTLK